MDQADEAERRRAIEVVLDRRPDVELGELADILAELGTPVDEATLVADLDALGFEVEGLDGDPGRAPAPATATAGPRFTPPAPSGATGAEEAPGRSRPAPGVVVAAAVLVLALVVAAVLFLRGGGDGDDAEADEAATTTAPGATDPTVPPTTATFDAVRGDGIDPVLAGPGAVVDDFEREGPEPGEVPGIGAWEVLAGDWGLADGQIRGAGVEAEGGNLIVFDPGTPDPRLQTEVVQRTNGSGVAFRVVDADNYWAWVTAPELGTIGLVQVADGERRAVLNIGLAPTGDGMPALGVAVSGTTVELLFDGAVTATFDQLPPPEGDERVGLTMARGEGEAVFDDLRTLPA